MDKQKEKYKVLRELGYPVLSRAAEKIDISAEYYIVGYSNFYYDKPIIERTDRSSFQGNNRWIVDETDLIRL